MGMIEDLFSKTIAPTTNADEANEVFEGILGALRVHAIGSTVPHHAILWARRLPTGPLSEGEAKPVMLPLETEEVQKFATVMAHHPEAMKRLGIDDPGVFLEAFRESPSDTKEQMLHRYIHESASSYVAGIAIERMATITHAAAVTLIMQSNIIESQDGQRVTVPAVVVHHDHVLTGSCVRKLVAETDGHGRILKLGEPQPLVGNVNPATARFNSMLPPSCYGIASNGPVGEA